MIKFDPAQYGEAMAAMLQEAEDKILSSDSLAEELKRLDEIRSDHKRLDGLRYQADKLEKRLYELLQSINLELQLLEIEEYERRVNRIKIGSAEKKVIRRVTDDITKTLSFLTLFLQEITNILIVFNLRALGMTDDDAGNTTRKVVDIDVDRFGR